MKGWISLLLLVACTAGDDVANGARDNCAEGGTLNQCPPAEPTARGACWKLVACGALALDRNMSFDWGECVEYVEGMSTAQEELVVACIINSTCDQLKYDTDFCFRYGNF